MTFSPKSDNFGTALLVFKYGQLGPVSKSAEYSLKIHKVKLQLSGPP